jgi:hypothetical protein
MCLREGREKALTVRTCYFIAAIRSAPPGRRWRLLVLKLLTRYAKDNGDGTFSPPERSARPRPGETTGEWVHNPRFRTEARWGVDGVLVEPWNNLPNHWPPPAPPAAPATTLRPRHTY